MAPQKIWTQHDMQSLIDQLDPPTALRLKQLRPNFDDLFCVSRDKIDAKYHHLLVGRDADEALDASDAVLQLLLGQNWLKSKEVCHYNYTKKTLGRHDFTLDLSDVQDPYKLSKFNILSRNRGVLVNSVEGHAEAQIPPIINLCVALSLEACEHGRGIFLWQRKKRSNADGYAHWQRVPDLVLLDFRWTEEQRVAFRESTFDEMRETLCANLNPILSRADIVLPFLVDFPGETLVNDEDARITFDVDNISPPKAAITIPGAAYIGWLDDMMPYDNQQIRLEKPTKTNSDGTRMGKSVGCRAEVILTPRQRHKLQVRNVKAMYERAMEMLESPVPDSLVSYADVDALMLLATTIVESPSDHIELSD